MGRGAGLDGAAGGAGAWAARESQPEQIGELAERVRQELH